MAIFVPLLIGLPYSILRVQESLAGQDDLKFHGKSSLLRLNYNSVTVLPFVLTIFPFLRYYLLAGDGISLTLYIAWIICPAAMLAK